MFCKGTSVWCMYIHFVNQISLQWMSQFCFNQDILIVFYNFFSFICTSKGVHWDFCFMLFTHAIIWCSRGFLFYVIFTCGRHHFISNLPSSKAGHCSIISLDFIEKLRFIYFEWILIQKYASPFGYMEERLF